MLFTSESFKSEAVRFAKVKSPAEMVAGTLRFVEDHREIKPGLFELSQEPKYMGMDLMNPPTVEGWHTGQEWIDSGTLVERINFAADQVGNTSLPGVQSIINRLSADARAQSPEGLVDACLDMLGTYQLPEETRRELVDHVAKGGQIQPDSQEYAGRVGQVLQLIVATQEYQFA